MVEFLIKNGIDIHADDDALIKAVQNVWVDIVKLLLKNGANPHAQDDAAIKEAELKGSYMIDLLLSQKRIAPPPFGTISKGSSPPQKSIKVKRIIKQL